jgi:hypothetical protein
MQCHHAYVVGRLQRWSTWSWRRLDGGGYRVAQFHYCEPTEFGRVPGAVVPVETECVETDQSLGWLRLARPRWADTIAIMYRDRPNYSAEQVATLMHVGVRTLFRDLDASYSLLLGYFVSRAAGEPLPQLAELRATTRRRAA